MDNNDEKMRMIVELTFAVDDQSGAQFAPLVVSSVTQQIGIVIRRSVNIRSIDKRCDLFDKISEMINNMLSNERWSWRKYNLENRMIEHKWKL